MSTLSVRRARVTVVSVVLALGLALALSITSKAQANPYNCGGEYACQFADTGYGGQRDYYGRGFGDFRYASSNAGTCLNRGFQNWNDCARSTFNSHLSVTVGWFYNAGCTSYELQNTPSSGSPDLSRTYAGNFYQQLSSVEYFGTPASC